jgi:hypothetical protein
MSLLLCCPVECLAQEIASSIPALRREMLGLHGPYALIAQPHSTAYPSTAAAAAAGGVRGNAALEAPGAKAAAASEVVEIKDEEEDVGGPDRKRRRTQGLKQTQIVLCKCTIGYERGQTLSGIAV